MSGSNISDTCVVGVDADAVRRFGAVARRAFREIDNAAETAWEVQALVADLVPHSSLAGVWCESADAAADLVRRSAQWFARLADHTEIAVEGYAAADRAGAGALLRLEVRW
ncbi:hypothetical protein [Nocardia aurantia]|uniref:PE domain-containing protein n=1 Tax=Nocardia aurantia TaxID=2585199 RepID=A0A7K0DVV0_9NOCA|nr:hypothetical protein [Nocardia aurantia]MQY29909.1 hypothetical protein [Nocardia aurantia]